MTMVAAGGEKKLGRFLESQKAYIEGANNTNSWIMENVGRALCKGVIAFRRSDYAKASDMISGVLDQTYRIGGSNAQRDLFRLTAEAAKMNLVLAHATG